MMLVYLYIFTKMKIKYLSLLFIPHIVMALSIDGVDSSVLTSNSLVQAGAVLQSDITNIVTTVVAEQTQILTYYVWGSSNGPISSTRLATIESSALRPAFSNVATSVTNGQLIGAYSVLLADTPTTIETGVLAIHANLVRTGNSQSRTIMGVLSVLESDKATLVASYTNSLPRLECPTTLTHVDMEIPVTSVAMTNSRYITLKFYADTGWTGTETIQSYSQNGYLTRFEFPASPVGVYARQSDFNSLKNSAISNNMASAVTLGSNLTVGGSIQGTFDPVYPSYNLLANVVANTATISRAMGQSIVCDLTTSNLSPVYITADATYPNTADAGVNITVRYTTQTWGFVSSVLSNTATISSNTLTTINFVKGYGQSYFNGVKLQ